MRVRLFLGMTAVLAIVAGLTAFIALRVDQISDDAGSPVVDGTVGEGTGGSTTTTAGAVPARGSIRVTGTITELHLEGAVLDPRTYPTPLTLTSDRGLGNGGEINTVTVDGKPAAIVWDGGRPLVLSSGGGLVLDPVDADLAPEGIRLGLAVSVQGFAPGTYQLDTPVAVGTSGVASARDAVTFTATDGSTFEASGDTALVLDPSAPRRFGGPGMVHLGGALEVTDAAGATTTVRTIDLAAGPYDLTFTPAAGGGWTVSGTLQGPVTVT